MASENMEVAALGRPFTVGMLYDARKDKLIPGLTLQDDATLQNKIHESSQQGSTFQITSSDSIQEKTSLLDVEASLKASFLGGLIEVGGSAKYLNDQKKFKNQSRVTLQYKATTHFKQLSLSTPEARKTHQIDDAVKSVATHVVTAILYGANAFFVFDSQKLQADSVQEIQGSMEAVIRKIPALDIQGKVDIKLSDKEKELTDKFSCTFHGDFILDSNPATFQDAVKTYQELPKLLGAQKENSVPLKVWLMPLKKLDSTAADIVKQIEVAVVSKVQEALDGVNELKMRCNESLEDSLVECFPQIQKKLSRFQRNCDDYRSSIKEAIAKKLPSIRAGEEDECSLEKLFEHRDTSPFSDENLNNWLLDKERQINIIKSCLDGIDRTNIIANESQFDRVIFTPGVEDILCFVFTSLESADSYLDKMVNYLHQHDSKQAVDVDPPSKDRWYKSDEVISRMKEKAKLFHALYKELKNSSRVRLVVTTKSDEKNRGASLYHYSKGKLITADFTKPDVPPVEKISDKSSLMWYACDLTMDTNTVNYDLTLSDGNKKATHGTRQSYPDHPKRFRDFPQVLCNESLTGRHYWEVEWEDGYNEDVAVGVAYKEIPRTGEGSLLGRNDMSWCFGLYTVKPELFRSHKNNCKHLPFPPTGCKRLGVYLDWPAGTLSFYQVSSNTLSHLYTYHTTFTQPVYPGCFIKSQRSSAYLCPIN
ncbi:neoverrucotoxin subunit beta-like [Anabas testudineus]|uniref:neoverrucotoxin subunit beta-like n=1 Tax=Anabas testudineus TaxID=64144 RepID=UPI000E456F93|nr:neoverrucotoxin subunit beta-like [Anabas testudineus]XP_026212354.1 neoverrucotoxin subunit beta-like [Anabas testudineus]